MTVKMRRPSYITERILRNSVLILIFLLIFLLRLPSSTRAVIDWDDSIYFTVAQDLANGGSLYVTSWDHKPPILYFIFVPIIKLFGNNIFALRVFTTFYLLLTMFFVFLISKELFGKQYGLIPPLVYGLFFMNNWAGMPTSGELLMMLPATIATFCFVKYMNSTHTKSMLFLCGFFSATAVLVKQTAFFTIILFPLILILKKTTEKSYGLKTFGKEVFWYAAGGFTLTGIVLIYFIINQSLYELYHTIVTLNRQYVAFVPLERAFILLSTFLKDQMKSNLITIMTAVSIVFMFTRKNDTRNPKLAYFILALLLLSLVGVFWGRNMYPHYYLQMGLAFSLAIGFAVALTKIREKQLTGIVLVIIVIALYANSENISKFPNNYKHYKENELYEVSKYVANNTTKEDTIFVLGGQPIIYFLSERKSPTKHFMWLFHRRQWKGILTTEENTLTELSQRKPKYIVYNKGNFYGFLASEVPHLEKFMKDNYHLEKEIGSYAAYRINE